MSPLPHPLPAEAGPALPAAAARPADAVEVARILGAWGVKGGLKLKAYAGDPQALFVSRRWFIEPPEAGQALRRPMPAAATPAVRVPGGPVALQVQQVREQGEHIVATSPDITERDLAQALAGWRVFVERSSFPRTGDGEFYWIDLIGLQVRNREGQALGQVSGLIETGPHCVLKVQPGPRDVPCSEGDERLIPFVDAYVDSVDLPGRLIRVDWDAGF